MAGNRKEVAALLKRRQQRERADVSAFAALIAAPVTTETPFTLPANARLRLTLFSFDADDDQIADLGGVVIIDAIADMGYAEGVPYHFYVEKGKEVTINPDHALLELDTGFVFQKIAGGTLP